MKIDKGVPMPTKRGKLKNIPFDKMEAGDSIFFPLSSGQKINTLQQLLSRECRLFRERAKCDCAFSTKTWKQEGVEGVRLWRHS